MRPRVAVLSGFGINCELETMAVFRMAGAEADRIHLNRLVRGEKKLSDYQIMAIPGGFSFGDYLGSGRLLGNRLRFGLREEVTDFVTSGKPVIGICNGFQILTECNLLEGALLTNSAQLFKCEDVFLKVVSKNKFTNGYRKNEVISYPIAHSQGNYFVDDQKLKELEDNDQIIFKYTSKDGLINNSFNPNGSKNNVAGIVNKKKNVLGLMPHPERAIDNFSSRDGKIFFKSIYEML